MLINTKAITISPTIGGFFDAVVDSLNRFRIYQFVNV